MTAIQRLDVAAKLNGSGRQDSPPNRFGQNSILLLHIRAASKKLPKPLLPKDLRQKNVEKSPSSNAGRKSAEKGQFGNQIRGHFLGPIRSPKSNCRHARRVVPNEHGGSHSLQGMQLPRQRTFLNRRTEASRRWCSPGTPVSCRTNPELAYALAV